MSNARRDPADTAALGCAFAWVAVASVINLALTVIGAVVGLIVSIGAAVICWSVSIFDASSARAGSHGASTPAVSSKMDVDAASRLTFELTGGIIDILLVRRLVDEFRRKLNVASNHELAALAAIGLFRSDAFREQLRGIQMLARLTAMEWADAGKLDKTTLLRFENALYSIYSVPTAAGQR